MLVMTQPVTAPFMSSIEPKFGESSKASSSSSPIFSDALVPCSSSPSRSTGAARPLGPAKLIAMSRRGVVFSPSNDTKYFDSRDSILPLSEADPLQPPASIRSYAGSDSSSAHDSPGANPTSSPSRADTPVSVRSILKRKAHEIRLAANVEEGTMGNKEAARLIVSGKRPQLVARDSYQLAMMRKAADDSTVNDGSEKVPDAPGSDDSASSEEARNVISRGSSESDEEEESIEEDGSLAIASLVSIILDGADDLLTLEEAYSALSMRLRQRLPVMDGLLLPPAQDGQTKPIRDEAPAIIRALHRDLARLMGKVPMAETPSVDVQSSPFRHLMPLRDSTPVNQSEPLTPAHTPTSPKDSGSKTPRKGYTEAEVRYRREAAGVGHACLRFLTFTFNDHRLYSCFSEADLQSLLDRVLAIPRTPKLPTPNSKKTYHTVMQLVSQMRIASTCVLPVKDKVVHAIESALNGNLEGGAVAAGPVPQSNGAVRKEAFTSVLNMMTTYPSIFFPFYANLLPQCLRTLTHPTILMKSKAASVVTAFAAAKTTLASQQDKNVKDWSSVDTATRTEWTDFRKLIIKFEYFVLSHFKSAHRIGGRPDAIYGNLGEKHTEWSKLEDTLKDAVTSEVHWACATWAAVVSLIGSAYATSRLQSSLDFIMDRSLQPSTNMVRATLARSAWAHAIHAYMSSGTQASISDDGQLQRSYSMWASLGDKPSHGRLEQCLLPAHLALDKAVAADSYHLSLVPSSGSGGEQRYIWKRVDKSKKIQWMKICYENLTDVLYAYLGASLDHQDQPASEMTTISGLPSSDGIPIPEDSMIEARNARIDKVWARIIEADLAKGLQVFGLDEIKMHSWTILESLLRPSRGRRWSLDNLLCTRFMVGDAFTNLVKDQAERFTEKVDAERVNPADLPSLPPEWIVSRLPKVLDLFQIALQGLNGVNYLPKNDSTDMANSVQFPYLFTKIFVHILKAVKTIQQSDPEQFTDCIRLITRHLCQIFNRDPTCHMPISNQRENKSWIIDPDVVRLTIFGHLLNVACAIFDHDTIAGCHLSAEGDDVDEAMAHMAFGKDSHGKFSMAGCLLSLLVGTKVLSPDMTSIAKSTLRTTVQQLLDLGCYQGVQARLLGDMTNRIHAAFESQEDVQLDMWRILASKWARVEETGRPSNNSSTNHTGALLVNLLSSPFRERQVDSVWHQSANEDDLAIWKSLLDVTVARFRAKKVGANLGVLESLAGHLGDFLRDANKACSTTITLSCLAAATSQISFGTLLQHNEDHFSLNENFIPTEFLSLVSLALKESYPVAPQSLDSNESQEAVSPAVFDLLNALSNVISTIPAEFVMGVLELVKEGVALWLADEQRVVAAEQAQLLDEFYGSILGAVRGAANQKAIAVTSETLDLTIELFAPRLSRAISKSVPQAFQAFWQPFSVLSAQELSEEVTVFLQSVISAVPGIITVKDLTVGQTMSEDESVSRFPHAQHLGTEAQDLIPPTPTGPEPELTATPHVEEPEMSIEYDADVSQTVQTQDPAPTSGQEPLAADALPMQSPNPSETESERNVMSSLNAEKQREDVFGFSQIAKPSRSTKRRRGITNKAAREEKVSRPRGSSESSNGASDASTPIIIDDSDEDDDSGKAGGLTVPLTLTPAEERRAKLIALAERRAREADTADIAEKDNSQHGRAGLLSSASRWMSRIPSFGGLFSPSRPGEEAVVADEESETSPQIAASRPGSRVRKGGKPNQLGRHHSEPQISTLRSVPPSTSATKSRKWVAPAVADGSDHRAKRYKTTILPKVEIEIDDSDEEDELLLSPESARRRRAEEQRAIEAASAKAATPDVKVPVSSQSSTGQFDDAQSASWQRKHTSKSPASSSPSRGSSDTTTLSPLRNTQQAHILSMVDQAAQAKDVIDSMNFDDLREFMKHLEVLRGAAQRNLEGRVEEGRRGKRRRSGA